MKIHGSQMRLWVTWKLCHRHSLAKYFRCQSSPNVQSRSAAICQHYKAFSSDAKVARVMSGIQATGSMHVGNYFGAIRKWVALQDQYQAVYSIVDLHSITTPQEPEMLRKAIFEAAVTLLACGIDPKKAILFKQSDVGLHCELAWILACVTPLQKLRNLSDWKEKCNVEKHASLGLFSYPVLQAADILLYRANFVPVGDDQRKHLELCCDIVRRFAHKFGDVLVKPEALFEDSTSMRIKNLQNPLEKMSKSSKIPKSRIHVTDDADQIRDKIKKAVSDSERGVTFDLEKRPGVSNLIALYSACSDQSAADICEQAEKDNLRIGDLKELLTEALISHLRPVREEFCRLRCERGYVDAVLSKGAERAAEIAYVTLADVKNAVGLSWNERRTVATEPFFKEGLEKIEIAQRQR